MNPINVVSEFQEFDAMILYTTLIKKEDGEFLPEDEQKKIADDLNGKIFYKCVIIEKTKGVQLEMMSPIDIPENKREILAKLLAYSSGRLMKFLQDDFYGEMPEQARIIQLNGNSGEIIT